MGERWVLLVLRELLLGPKRFSDLSRDLPGISANILTRRLEGLEAVGILVRRRLPPPVSARVYELTPWGYESESIFQELGRWAARSPEHDPSLPLSAVPLLISFRTTIEPDQAEGFAARVGFRIGEETFLAHLHDGTIEVSRGDADTAEVVFTGSAPAIAAAVYGGQPLDGLIAAGALALDGDWALAERFVTLFPLPAKVGSTT